jgi:putative endonuclease
MYYLYILKSIRAGRFYTGVTKNIEERLKNHNKGGTKSTKPFKPWKIVYKEDFTDKKLAFKREHYLKSPKGYLEKKSILSKLI